MSVKTWLCVGLLAGWMMWPGAAFRTGAAPDGQNVLWHTPKPVYPAAARVQQAQGSGIVRLETDARGRMAKVTMEKSTGSQVLDENTVAYARANWTGPPNSAKSIPITYRQDRLGAAAVKRTARRGLVQVTFDSRGRAVTAKMKQSTGYKVLDDNTINHALANWTGTPNKTVDILITYVPR